MFSNEAVATHTQRIFFLLFFVSLCGFTAVYTFSLMFVWFSVYLPFMRVRKIGSTIKWCARLECKYKTGRQRERGGGGRREGATRRLLFDVKMNNIIRRNICRCCCCCCCNLNTAISSRMHKKYSKASYYYMNQTGAEVVEWREKK